MKGFLFFVAWNFRAGLGWFELFSPLGSLQKGSVFWPGLAAAKVDPDDAALLWCVAFETGAGSTRLLALVMGTDENLQELRSSVSDASVFTKAFLVCKALGSFEVCFDDFDLFYYFILVLMVFRRM